MTNWCTGKVRVLANDEILAQIREDIPVFALDAVTPMPTELKGLHSTSHSGAENGDIEVWRDGEGSDGMRDRIYVSSVELARLREQYGVVTQEDWAMREWGTRYNQDEYPWEEVGGCLVGGFMTPWSPPERAVATLSDRYRDATFVLTYSVEYIGSGWGAFSGGEEVVGGFSDFCLDCVMRDAGIKPNGPDNMPPAR